MVSLERGKHYISSVWSNNREKKSIKSNKMDSSNAFHINSIFAAVKPAHSYAFHENLLSFRVSPIYDGEDKKKRKKITLKCSGKSKMQLNSIYWAQCYWIDSISNRRLLLLVPYSFIIFMCSIHVLHSTLFFHNFPPFTNVTRCVFVRLSIAMYGFMFLQYRKIQWTKDEIIFFIFFFFFCRLTTDLSTYNRKVRYTQQYSTHVAPIQYEPDQSFFLNTYEKAKQKHTIWNCSSTQNNNIYWFLFTQKYSMESNDESAARKFRTKRFWMQWIENFHSHYHPLIAAYK